MALGWSFFFRRRKAAPPAEPPPPADDGPPLIGRWSSRGNQSDYGDAPNVLRRGQRYRVRREFTDHDRDLHPVGEEWIFLGHAFLPYHNGLSWFVSFDGVHEWHIRMQMYPEEQEPIVHNLSEYLEPIERPAG